MPVQPQELTEAQQNEDFESFAKILAQSLNQQETREFVKTEAKRKFDGDYDILYLQAREKTIKGKSLRNLLAETYQKSVGTKSNLDKITQKYPLLNIAVPVHIDKWNVADFKPLVAVIPAGFDEKTTKQIKAFDAEGKVHWLDAQKQPNFPVVVVGLNERVEFNADGSIKMNKYPSSLEKNEEEIDPGNGGGGPPLPTAPPCVTPYRVNDRNEYLTRLNFINILPYETWIQGAPELNIKIFAPNNLVNFSSLTEIWHFNYLEPSHRADIDNNWWSTGNMLLFKWNNAKYSTTIGISFVEYDPAGPIRTITVGGSFTVPIPPNPTLNLSIGINVTGESDDIGFRTIEQFDCPESWDMSSPFLCYVMGNALFFTMASF